jgi:hypothetical protein
MQATQIPSGTSHTNGAEQSELAWQLGGVMHELFTHWRSSPQAEPTGRPDALQSASVVQHAKGFRFVSDPHPTNPPTTTTRTTTPTHLMHSRYSDWRFMTGVSPARTESCVARDVGVFT